MAKLNEQLEDILDDLSVIKSNNAATEQRLSNIETLLAKLATKEDVAPIIPVASTSATSIPYDEIKNAVHEEMDSYYNAMSDSAELLSDKTLKRLGTIFIELYVEEIEKYLEKDEKERECKRNVYLQKRKAQGLMTIEQVAEWAPQYSLEIQRTIRYIGMKIIDENESVKKAHAILKIWGDALQTITSPKPSPPPTLKSWWLYRWNRFKQKTDKWRLLQWYLVILGIIACVLFSSLYQIGLWILTELTEFSTRRLSLMKRERRIIKSWIHLSTRIRFSRHIGVWNIEHLYKKKVNDVIDLYLIVKS